MDIAETWTDRDNRKLKRIITGSRGSRRWSNEYLAMEMSIGHNPFAARPSAEIKEDGNPSMHRAKDAFHQCQAGKSAAGMSPKAPSLDFSDWYNVVWSDETSVEIGRQRRDFVLRFPHEKYHRYCTNNTTKSGKPKVMF